MKKIVTLIIVVLLFGTAQAAVNVNAMYFTHSGTISYWGGATTIAEAVKAPDDGWFVQLGRQSYIVLRFPDNYVAAPDGTSAPDLQVDIYDALFGAEAEVLVSLDGSNWTSVGVYADTANIDLDLEGVGMVKYVKVDQDDYDTGYPDDPDLGFDLDGVVALNAVLLVDIDIKPGSWPNPINLKSRGVVPVALLTTDDFDAGTVDPTTVEFAGAAPVRWTLGNVDGDGDYDMLFHFRTQELNLNANSTEATLTGETEDGQRISGTDKIRIVPPKKNQQVRTVQSKKKQQVRAAPRKKKR